MIPSIYEISDILFKEDACERFLIERGAFYRTLDCPGCGKSMNRNEERKTFRCTVKRCRKEFSMRKYTFFYGSMLKNYQILYLAYLWLSKVSSSSACTVTGFSKNTVTSFYRHFRSLVASTLDLEDCMIG